MADTTEKESKVIAYITRVVIIAIIIWALVSSENVRNMAHRIYNFLPPQKVRLTILLKNEQNDALSNRLLVFDKKDSAYTDNDGELNIDLLKGRHVCTVIYADSAHNNVLNLKKDSLISMVLLLNEPDIVEGGDEATDTVGQNEIDYPTQYFKVGNTLQFGHINVKFLKLDNARSVIYVSVCHTVKDYVCQNTIIANSALSKDSLLEFADNRYSYKLMLQKIDEAQTDSATRVAYVSITQRRK